MPLRLLRYVLRIWEKQLDDAPQLAHLPPVVPVVLHHDPGGWSAPTSLQAIVEPAVGQVPGLALLVPDFSFVLDDLAAVDDAALEARALGAFPRLVLWALRDARSPGRLGASLGRWIDAMRELLGQPQGLEALMTLMRYIFLVADEGSFRQVRTELQALPSPAKEQVLTIAEWLRAEGRKDGIKEGTTAGEVREARRALRRVLARRGLTLSGAQDAAIDGCDDLPTLERWHEHAIEAADAASALA
jgi:hypothetical protein